MLSFRSRSCVRSLGKVQPHTDHGTPGIAGDGRSSEIRAEQIVGRQFFLSGVVEHIEHTQTATSSLISRDQLETARSLCEERTPWTTSFGQPGGERGLLWEMLPRNLYAGLILVRDDEHLHIRS